MSAEGEQIVENKESDVELVKDVTEEEKSAALAELEKPKEDGDNSDKEHEVDSDGIEIPSKDLIDLLEEHNDEENLLEKLGISNKRGIKPWKD